MAAGRGKTTLPSAHRSAAAPPPAQRGAGRAAVNKQGGGPWRRPRAALGGCECRCPPGRAASVRSPYRGRGGAGPGPAAHMDDSKVVGGKVKKPGKRGRKPAKIDLKAKLERSRQSARECRARKKLRYQYLEELVSSRERAICALREELEMYKQWCMAMDQGKIPSEIKALLTGEEQGKAQQNSTKLAKAGKTEANSSNPLSVCSWFSLTNIEERK
uniref:cAMP-responsive element-binding protein-like 2 n=8 Tax=Neognathae TaxID=8825 RepID=A0A663EHD8_AQUCH